MMYPSTGDVNDNSEAAEQQSNGSNSNFKSSTSNCQAFLVIDDNSNSEDSSVLVISNKNNLNTTSSSLLTSSTKSSMSTNPPAPPPAPLSSSSHHSFMSAKEKTNLDLTSDTPEQQRRRNSSIAKLLGGQPLNNQQYVEIHQQILDDQSAQNQSHNNENGIQRSRSSITRTLLMNNPEKSSKTLGKTSTSSTFGKGVEYLLRPELDNEHSSTGIQRNGSASNIFPSVNGSINPNAQIPSSSRFKRKRSIPKLLSPMNLNKTSMNIPPFALHNSIEIDNSSNDVSANGQNSNGNTNIPTLNRSSHREQLESHPFNSSTHPAFASPGQYSTSTFPKSNSNSSPFHQFNLHPERLTGHHRSFSFHYPHYSSPMKLSFPSPILPLSSGAMTTLDDSNVTANSTKKLKSMLFGTDAFEPPRKRSFSNLSKPTTSNVSDSYVPLKKRLLHAYQNEQESPSPL